MALDFTKHATLLQAFDYFKAAWAEYEKNMTEANMNGAHLAWNRLQKMPTTCVNDVLLKLQAFAFYRDAQQSDWGLDPMSDHDLRHLQELSIAAQEFAPTVANYSTARRGMRLIKNCTNLILTDAECAHHHRKLAWSYKADCALFSAAKAIVAHLTGLTVARVFIEHNESGRPNGDCELVTISTDFESQELAPFRMAGLAALLIFGRDSQLAKKMSRADAEAADHWATVGEQEASNLLKEPWVWDAVLFTANAIFVYGSIDGQHIPNIVSLFTGEITRSEFEGWEALSGLRMLAAQ